MEDFPRRLFLTRILTGSGAALALTTIPKLAAAYDHSLHAKKGETKLKFFSPHEAKQMEAVCERIIPSDDGPGASEAGAIFFIDFVLTDCEPELQPTFRKGLEYLAQQAAPKSFAELPEEQQIAILKKYESSEEFQKFRTYTILGFLADPAYGGNRGHVGWKYIGFEDAGMFHPPFGYYDAEFLAGKKDGE